MEPTAAEFRLAVISATNHRLEYSMNKIKHCLDQLTDEQLWWRPHESMNSIANLILHLCGNIRQWMVSGIGGTPDRRDRAGEFAERSPISKPQLVQRLQQVVAEANEALDGLSTSELLRIRRIQGFDVSGLGAIFDAIPHLQGHTQEIICLTRMQLGDQYQVHWSPTTPEEGAPE